MRNHDHARTPATPMYGVLAEFEGPDQLLEAARRVRAEGYRRIDAFTPYPVEGLAEAIGFRRTMVPALALAGGAVGCLGGFFLQYYIAVHNYPINVGGRPLNSWPYFIPIAFEMTVLLAAICTVVGMLALNRLPMPHHPLFNDERFSLASSAGFFLAIESADSTFDRNETVRLLERLDARQVSEVKW